VAACVFAKLEAQKRRTFETAPTVCGGDGHVSNAYGELGSAIGPEIKSAIGAQLQTVGAEKDANVGRLRSLARFLRSFLFFPSCW
jgi:hypothetical protein